MNMFGKSIWLLAVLCGACSDAGREVRKDPLDKVEIDLSRIDANGLRGPTDGKVAVSYELVIPDTEDHRRQVRSIDRTVQFMAGSKGCVGAGQGECLCKGSTHQNEIESVLRRFAELTYVDRIIDCYLE